MRVDDFKVLTYAAEHGSLSAAARELAITPAVASVAIKRLEDALGTRLLVRSTRSLRLTTAGAYYLGHAKAALNALNQGQKELHHKRQETAGELSLAVPSDLGRNVLLGWWDAFMAQHPQLHLRLRVSDRVSDLFRQPVEIALRYGVPEDSSLVTLPLKSDNYRVVCASPDYITRHGSPACPDDLRQHNCLCFVLGDGVHNQWKFGSDNISVKGNRVSDDAECVRRWAVAGEGIAYKSRLGLDVEEDLRNGRLVAMLEAFPCEPTPLYLVCPHRLSLTPAVIALKDFLIEQLKGFIR